MGIISEYKPQLLVAMPTLKDGYFDKSVVLLCDYDENGAMGFVINSPSQTSVAELLGEMGLKTDPPQESKIMIGGPVQAEMCWVLHTPEFCGQSTNLLGDTVALSAAQEVLTSITEGLVPLPYLLGVGYAGWGPGQLENEIEQGAWWLTDLDPFEIIRLPSDQRWENLITRLGLNTSYACYQRA